MNRGVWIVEIFLNNMATCCKIWIFITPNRRDFGGQSLQVFAVLRPWFHSTKTVGKLPLSLPDCYKMNACLWVSSLNIWKSYWEILYKSLQNSPLINLCFLEMIHYKEINFNFLNSKNSIKTRIVSVHTCVTREPGEVWWILRVFCEVIYLPIDFLCYFCKYLSH